MSASTTQVGHKNAKMLRYQYHTYFTTFSSVCAQKVRQGKLADKNRSITVQPMQFIKFFFTTKRRVR